jgi:hypothetical protein
MRGFRARCKPRPGARLHGCFALDILVSVALETELARGMSLSS